MQADKQFRDLPFSGLLKYEELLDIQNNSNQASFFKGDTLVRQNTRTSHVLFLKEGLVKVHKEGRNKGLILKLITSGNFLALLSIFGSDVHHFSISVVEKSEVIYIDITTMKRIIHQNGDYALALNSYICQSGLFIFQRFMDHHQKQLPGRIADVLIYFSEEIYQSDDFLLPLTRRELAEMAGTTKESFIRTLTEFKNDRIICLEGKRVKIRSRNILDKLSQFG